MLKCLLLVAVLSVGGVACKKKSVDNDLYHSEAQILNPQEHEKLLGAEARCPWKNGTTYSAEVLCVSAGKRLYCIKGECATLSETSMEAK